MTVHNWIHFHQIIVKIKYNFLSLYNFFHTLTKKDTCTPFDIENKIKTEMFRHCMGRTLFPKTKQKKKLAHVKII